MTIAKIERVGERVRVWFRCACGADYRIPSGQPFVEQCGACREKESLHHERTEIR